MLNARVDAYKKLLVIFFLYPAVASGKPVHFLFITKWQVRAPLEKVWAMIDKTEDWPQWWKGIDKAVVTDTGKMGGTGKIIHYKVRSFLPFALSFNLRITERDEYKRIRAIASGDLDGVGEWTFTESQGITYVEYKWDVVSTKKLVNFLSHAGLKGFFSYNHSLVMHWGAKRLAKKLHAELLEG